jgi:excisionase family DNA binding protein
MTETVYKTYDDLPMFLNVATVAKLLGISQSSGYELMHEKDFPAIKIGSRIVVPRDNLVAWIEEKMAQ